MSLQLDERQRAMLARMGAPWLNLVDTGRVPAAADVGDAELVAPARADPPASAAVAAPSVRAAPAPAPVPPTEARSPPVPATDIDAMGWVELEAAVGRCEACKLCKSRTRTVFGVGDRQAQWMIVGEAPGENEDLQGEPFVGQAGKLLDNMLKAVGRSRRQGAYIANVLKCRPPGNRNPEPDEVAQCEPYLRRQVELLQPQVILAMGRFAVQSVLQTTEPIGRLRGRAHQYNGVPVIVTYHPAYLLRNLPEKAKAWADLCLAAEITAASGRSA